jgi:two-component system nitrate/nitrite response regulator NarL
MIKVNPMPSIRAHLIDPNPLSREGLTAVLEGGGVNVVGYSDTVAVAPQQPDPDQHDVTIVDSTAYPQGIKFAMFEDLRRRFAGSYLVALIQDDDLDALKSCVDNKLDGAIPKTFSGSVFIKVLQVIIEGERYFPASMLPADARTQTTTAFDATQSGDGPELRQLTHSDRQILQQLASGGSNKAIASALGCAEATIKVHMKRILRKINVDNRTQAAVWALNNGLASPGNTAHPDAFSDVPNARR